MTFLFQLYLFNSVPALFRISYMWYSFLGTTLTILFGLTISFITEKISKTKVMSISKNTENVTEKPKDTTVFSIATYRKKSQTNSHNHLHGIDNIALKIEDEI